MWRRLTLSKMTLSPTPQTEPPLSDSRLIHHRVMSRAKNYLLKQSPLSFMSILILRPLILPTESIHISSHTIHSLHWPELLLKGKYEIIAIVNTIGQNCIVKLFLEILKRYCEISCVYFWKNAEGLWKSNFAIPLRSNFGIKRFHSMCFERFWCLLQIWWWPISK